MNPRDITGECKKTPQKNKQTNKIQKKLLLLMDKKFTVHSAETVLLAQYQQSTLSEKPLKRCENI